MNKKQKQEIESLLKTSGFVERKGKPGIWTKGEPPFVELVDLNKTPPEVALLSEDGFTRIKEGHGVDELYELEQRIEGILKMNREQSERHNTPTEGEKTSQESTTELNRAPQTKHDISLTTANTPDLSIDTIKKYINPRVTDQEAYAFLQLCQYRELNPFLNEAYLIKYGDEPATIVVGKDAFTRRAEEHLAFDGYEAGIIVQNTEEKIERREGAFHTTEEKLLGGWAKVYRKDRSHPFVSEVSMSEYQRVKRDGTPMSSWASMPATMIRKVALVQALREAFPSDLGGMYDQFETGVDV